MFRAAAQRNRIYSLVVVLAVSLIPFSAHSQSISGATGASSQWGSAWMDLAPPMDFKKGEKLKIQLGGSAEKVLVRLLPRGMAPDQPTGIVGGPLVVPKSRIIEVALPNDHKQIVQISVHGGPNPWGQFPLGGGNGPATIASIEVVR